MSERQANSMKSPVLLEIFLLWLKYNEFFCLPSAKNKHSWIPSVLSSFLIYKHTTKASLFSPSIAFLIQTSFLFGVLFLTSICFYPFLYGLLSLFAFRFLTFFYFWVVSFCRTICMSRSFFILHPVCSVPGIIHHLCFYLFLSSWFLFLYLWPLISSPGFSCSHLGALWPNILSQPPA